MDDETKLYELRVEYRDLGKRLNQLDAEIDDFTARIRRVTPKIRRATRRIHWLVRTRIPHIKRRIREREQASSLNPTGSRIVTFDGRPVAEWIGFILQLARAAGWVGGLNSGYRSPEYSEELCYRICGQPTCPGRCAGRYTNHAKREHPDGAADVSYPEQFEEIVRQLYAQGRIPTLIFNALGAADPWHMSSDGR